MSLEDQRILKSLLELSPHMILKSLGDLCGDLGLPAPIYVQFPNIDSGDGFSCRCDVNMPLSNHSETGHGASKKIATRNAARKMFSYLKGREEEKREILDEDDVADNSEREVKIVEEDLKTLLFDTSETDDVNSETSEIEDVKIDVLGADNSEELVALFKQWKTTSRKPAMMRLHSQPISSPYSQLKQLCEEEGLEIQFDDHDGVEGGDGNNNVEEEWQSVLNISTMFAFCGTGATSEEARSEAAKCALMYLRFMTRQ